MRKIRVYAKYYKIGIIRLQVAYLYVTFVLNTWRMVVNTKYIYPLSENAI